MNNNTDIFLLEYPQAKAIVVSGDIHGDFNALVFKLCVQYQMTDTLLVVAGDCGFGFDKPGYYDEIVKKNAKRMNKANNWIVFVRGNHDNPAYFDGKVFCHKRFIAVPDYTIIKVCSHTILCVGGATSIDRQYRITKRKEMIPVHTYTHNHTKEDTERFAKDYYWENEAPVFDKDKLLAINENNAVDVVITHTAPSFCELIKKEGLTSWAIDDPTLIEDADNERKVMDNIYDLLVYYNHPLERWYYGHFHQSWHSPIEGVMFSMLDIMEFQMIPPRNDT